MKLAELPRKVLRGMPYLEKEIKAIVSDNTPFFVAVPRSIHIWRSAPCNAKCIMCEYGYSTGDAYKKISTISFSDEQMMRAIEEVHELSGRGTLISFIGGEPTLAPRIVDWVRKASSLGLDFRFTTNGYKMDRKMAANLIDAGVFNIGVSLESMDAKVNEFIRPFPLGTEKTIKAIEYLLEERDRQKKHVSINIKTVITELNLDAFIEIVERWGKLDGVMCTPQLFEYFDEMPLSTRDTLAVKNVTKLKKVIDRIAKMKSEGYAIHISDQGLREMLRLAEGIQDRSTTANREKIEMDPSEPMCNIATDNLFIQHGLVKLCPHHAPIGNMHTEKRTLKQMWNDEMALKVRAATRACRRICTSSCLRRSPLKHKVSMFLKIA